MASEFLDIGNWYQTQSGCAVAHYFPIILQSLLTSHLLIVTLSLTWEDKHHNIVQRLTEAGAAHSQRGVEVIKEGIEQRHQQPGGASHNVPHGEQGLARTVL